MRIALFGEGNAVERVKESLSAEHRLTVFVPRRGSRIGRFLRGQTGVSRPELASLRIEADLICIAGFPWLLPPQLLEQASRGALNVHPSLLPRHRGPLPLFWVYHADDRETGVTVHRVVAEADAGEILAQSRFALPRGYPVRELAERKQRAGAELLRDVLSRLDSIAAVAQDHGLATPAPRVPRGARMVDFQTWPAERVWHFLRGLHPFFAEPLGVEYGGVGQWRTHGHDRGPGSVEASERGWLLYCVDGTVELTR